MINITHCLDCSDFSSKTDDVHTSIPTTLSNSKCPFHLSLSLSYGCYTLPSHCLWGYNSQIMSSSVMYSQCSVYVDLQATFPLSLTHTRSPGLLLAPTADYILFPKLLNVSEAAWLCFYIVLLMAVSTHHPSLCVCMLVSN